MECPACVLLKANHPCFESSKVLYIHSSKKPSPIQNIVHVQYPVFDCNEKRFDALALTVVDWLQGHAFPETVTVWMEDYAYNAQGKVFHIGENGGVLKNKLWNAGYRVNVVPPTVVKKLATGRGNADKLAMYVAFTKEIGIDLRNEFGSKAAGVVSPFSDIADAFWIAKYGVIESK